MPPLIAAKPRRTSPLAPLAARDTAGPAGGAKIFTGTRYERPLWPNRLTTKFRLHLAMILVALEARWLAFAAGTQAGF